MAITRYTRRPFTPWADIDDINDIMNRFFTRSGSLPGVNGDWLPAVNMVEGPEAYDVTVELPGFTSDDVEIDFENDVLTLRGEKTDERTEGDEKLHYHLWERRTGSFHRSFKLPGTIDGEHISAAFEDGVLSVRLPKAAETKGRRIPIGPSLEG